MEGKHFPSVTCCTEQSDLVYQASSTRERAGFHEGGRPAAVWVWRKGARASRYCGKATAKVPLLIETASEASSELAASNENVPRIPVSVSWETVSEPLSPM